MFKLVERINAIEITDKISGPKLVLVNNSCKFAPKRQSTSKITHLEFLG